MRAAGKLFAAFTIVVLATAIVFVLGMRKKSPLVRTAVRRVSRATRRVTIESAGTPGAYAAIVRHVGRKSGHTYETPVSVAPTEDGFVIMLPYGADTDWAKNVRSAQSATLVYDGETCAVDQPQVVADAARYFPEKDRRTQRLFGLDEYLRVRRL